MHGIFIGKNFFKKFLKIGNVLSYLCCMITLRADIAFSKEGVSA